MVKYLWQVKVQTTKNLFEKVVVATISRRLDANNLKRIQDETQKKFFFIIDPDLDIVSIQYVTSVSL